MRSLHFEFPPEGLPYSQRLVQVAHTRSPLKSLPLTLYFFALLFRDKASGGLVLPQKRFCFKSLVVITLFLRGSHPHSQLYLFTFIESSGNSSPAKRGSSCLSEDKFWSLICIDRKVRDAKAARTGCNYRWCRLSCKKNYGSLKTTARL